MLDKRESLRRKINILDIEMRYAYFRMKLGETIIENKEDEEFWREETRSKASASTNAIITLLTTSR